MEPLAQLKDIHLPEQIHNYPIAIGWWILAFAVIALIVFLSLKWLKQRKYKAKQRQAIKLLTTQSNHHEIIELLKWTTLHYFSRQKIASLHGKKFEHFLQQQLPPKLHEEFTTLTNNAFEKVYQRSANEEGNENDTFKQAAFLWLTHAIPSQKAKLEVSS